MNLETYEGPAIAAIVIIPGRPMKIISLEKYAHKAIILDLLLEQLCPFLGLLLLCEVSLSVR